ncbi:hypothetical protein [Bacillus sp. Au-Bac7]|uniref:hypothetical protein n=1 Tax=Bacillus sp. Au-Bac7 TaxID=2906458 RepID=UPI001E33F6D2|nr:hypothetical protein [Bacillus sp. Au-Bac7]MCE4051898.1 hypothetical protein [Bacillus sp. Au-Bac7]
MLEDFKKDMYFCYSNETSNRLEKLGIKPFFVGFSLSGKNICIYRKTKRLAAMLDRGWMKP